VVARVLFVSNLFPPAVEGGAEIIAFSEASRLAAGGMDVAVLAGTFADQEREPGSIDVDEMNGVPVYRVSVPPLDFHENFYRPATARYLRAVMSAHRPEVVHFHNAYRLGANLIPTAKEAGAKILVTLHDHWGFCFKGMALRNDGQVCPDPRECAVCDPWVRPESGPALPIRLRRDYVAWCLEQADLLIAPSEYLANAYRTAGMNVPIERLSYGVDLAAVPAEAKPASQMVRFICLAYLGEHKGIPVLLEAAERLASDRSIAGQWSLTIAGPGHLAERLKEDIANGRFAGAVQYLGQVSRDRAIELIKTSDVLVLASVWPENEPVTLLEAIASGTAQLASRIGGIPGLIEDEKSGLLFEPGNADDLVEKMRRYISNPALAIQHGDWNTSRRSDFDEARTIERLQQFYRDEARPPPHDTRVVICAGEAWPKEIPLLLHRFHVAEKGRFQVRFIWHEWADAAAWRQAGLLWLWSGLPPVSVVTRAFGQGLPVLAPTGSIAQHLEHQSPLVAGYSTPLEAFGAIAALMSSSSQDRPNNQRAPDLARLLSSIAPKRSFHLPTGAPG
jgi:glycosyltransferase involved in cell wall biosynthesis